jgi:Fic family protein
MRACLGWFNSGEDAVDPVIKAAIAQLWFVIIHPFDDGNGRIARAISDQALARSEHCAQRFYSMSAQIVKERQAYYDILEATQKGCLDITSWLAWFRLSRSRCRWRANDAGSPPTQGALLGASCWWRVQ